MAEAQKDFANNMTAGARSEPLASKRAAGAESDRRSKQQLRDRKGGASERLHPIVELTITRVREFIREPEAVFWVFFFPVLLAFALGIAFRNTSPEQSRIAVESAAQDRAALQLAESLSASADVEAVVLSPQDAANALRTGKVALVIRAASEPSTSDAAGAAQSFEYRYDPTRPESRMARLMADDALQRSYGRKDIADVSEETVIEPGARYIDFLIPGLIGMNLMGSGLWMLGFAVVNARMRKLLKRLAATPMRRSHYLLSFIFSRLVFLVIEVAAVIIFGRLAFDVAVHGSLINLTIITLVGAMSFAGIGLLVAARPKTIEGVSGLMNLVMLPMWLLSGTFFSAARFPESLQPFIKALPLTALNDSLRAVINEGAPLTASWAELAILLAWGTVSFVVALKIFRWQ